jgi:hypothetical protein
MDPNRNGGNPPTPFAGPAVNTQSMNPRCDAVSSRLKRYRVEQGRASKVDEQPHLQGRWRSRGH